MIKGQKDFAVNAKKLRDQGLDSEAVRQMLSDPNIFSFNEALKWARTVAKDDDLQKINKFIQVYEEGKITKTQLMMHFPRIYAKKLYGGHESRIEYNVQHLEVAELPFTPAHLWESVIMKLVGQIPSYKPLVGQAGPGEAAKNVQAWLDKVNGKEAE